MCMSSQMQASILIVYVTKCKVLGHMCKVNEAAYFCSNKQRAQHGGVVECKLEGCGD